MFTREDYNGYFDEIEKKVSEMLIIYTDMLNELEDRVVVSKIRSLTAEARDTYRFIKTQKEEKFSK